VIVDDPTPSDVTGGFIGAVANASNVLSPLFAGPPGTRPHFIAQPDGTYDHLLEFDGYGRLVPTGILGVASRPVPAGGACWPADDGSVVVRLNSVATGVSALRIGYLSAGSGQVLVTFGARSLLYNVQKGLHSAFLPVSGASAATVVIQQVSGAIPCIGNVQAGALLPSGAGPAIPPLAVNG
jgi:hypothetical protein